MKRYASYKTTDQSWITSIPDHWDFLRAKMIFDNPKEKNVGNKEKNVLSLTLRGVINNDIENPIGLAPSDYSTYQVFEKDDLVFKLIDLENISTSRVGIVPERGVMSSAYIRFAPRTEINIRYFYLQYYDWWARRIFNGLGAGVRQTLSASDLQNYKIAVPPRAEQDQIVRFLDWKVSQIDRLIAGYQKEIALLKERRTTIIDRAVTKGIDPEVDYMTSKAEWMGAVPAQWKSCRMKNIFTEINIRSIDGSEPHLSMSQKKGLITDEEMKERLLLSENYISGKVCEKDDLVLNRLKAHLEVFALAPQKGVVSPDYTVLRLKQNMVIPKYAEYLLKSNACRKELRIRVRGIVEGFWRLYTEDLGTIPVCLPDLPEQAEILNYISFHEKRIDAAIEDIDHQISLLGEYRTRLICDAVTGQIDVRDVVIPEGAAAGGAPVFCNDADEGEVGMDADEY